MGSQAQEVVILADALYVVQTTTKALIDTRMECPDLEKELALLRRQVSFWSPKFLGG